MEIPDFDHHLLSCPAFTGACTTLAEETRKMPQYYFLGQNDACNEVLVRQAEASHLQPELRTEELKANIGEIVLKVRGKINLKTMQLLSFYEDADEGDFDHCESVFPIPSEYSMHMVRHLQDLRMKEAIYKVAFSSRLHDLQKARSEASAYGDHEQKMSIEMRIGFLQRSFEEVIHHVKNATI